MNWPANYFCRAPTRCASTFIRLNPLHCLWQYVSNVCVHLVIINGWTCIVLARVNKSGTSAENRGHSPSGHWPPSRQSELILGRGASAPAVLVCPAGMQMQPYHRECSEESCVPFQFACVHCPRLAANWAKFFQSHSGFYANSLLLILSTSDNKTKLCYYCRAVQKISPLKNHSCRHSCSCQAGQNNDASLQRFLSKIVICRYLS